MAVVHGSGRLDAPLIVVAEQPSFMEVKLGEPLVGPAGKVYDRIRQRNKIPQTRIYKTNVIRESNENLENIVYKNVLTEKGKVYQTILWQELASLESKTILAFGNTALLTLTGHTGITKWRGSVIEKNGYKIIPAFHPATCLPHIGAYVNELLIELDMQKAWQVATGVYQPIPHTLLIQPSFKETITFLLDIMNNYGAYDLPIGHDIECDGVGEDKHITCLSYAVGDSNTGVKAICIPFVERIRRSWVSYYSPEQEIEIWDLISKIANNENIRKTGQNIVFDITFHRSELPIEHRNVTDTMVRQHAIMPEYFKGLDMIASLHTDIPYYKDDGKIFLKGETSQEKWWNYSAIDSVVPLKAYKVLEDKVENLGNTEVVANKDKLIPVLSDIMLRGINVNVTGLSEYANKLESQFNSLEKNIIALSEIPDLNIRSPLQLKKLFYEKLEYPIQKEKGKITCNVRALQTFITQGCTISKKLMEYRGLKKIHSTYCNLQKVDSDGRIRCSYNPVGTKLSRLSSSETVFGTGQNMQNWPKGMLCFLTPDPDHIFVSLDLSQIENRIVAYCAKSKKMMKAFDLGADIHGQTAKFLISVYSDRTDINIRDISPLGDGSKTWRDWGKRANHGLNYDFGPPSFALMYGVTLAQAKFIYAGYHKLYPEVQEKYHLDVRHSIQRTRTTTTLMGRVFRFYDKLADPLYKLGYASIPQGTVGDYMDKYALNKTFYSPKLCSFKLLNQVHDSMGGQLSLNNSWNHNAEMIRQIVSNMSVPLSVHGREFKVPVDVTIGKALGDNKELGTHHTMELKRSEIGKSSFPSYLKKCYEELS